MKRALDVVFPGIRKPSIDFGDVRDDLRAKVFTFSLDLSTARSIASGTAAILNLAGNSLYVDQNTDVGAATIVFSDLTAISPARFFTQGGFNAKVPFTSLVIENAAQVGKVLRLFYGVDVDFQPGLNAAVTISGNVSVTPALDTQGATLDRGYIYGASYKSTTNLAANTADAIFSPGSNVAGAIVWEGDYFSNVAGGGARSFLAKTSAPASPIDGDVIFSAFQPAAAIASNGGSLLRPVRIAAGKGLYRISQVAEGSVIASCLYTLL